MHCPAWDDAFSRQSAGIKFTHRPKIRFFFATQRRIIAPIYVKLGRADRHMGPLACVQFHLNRHREVGMGPQNIKNFHFLVQRGDSVDGFRKFLGLFIRPTILN